MKGSEMLWKWSLSKLHSAWKTHFTLMVSSLPGTEASSPYCTQEKNRTFASHWFKTFFLCRSCSLHRHLLPVLCMHSGATGSIQTRVSHWTAYSLDPTSPYGKLRFHIFKISGQFVYERFAIEWLGGVWIIFHPTYGLYCICSDIARSCSPKYSNAHE